MHSIDPLALFYNAFDKLDIGGILWIDSIILNVYTEQGGKLTGGQLLRRTVEASPLQSLEYATSWSLMHYLARYHRKELQSLLQDASQLEPLQRVAPGSLFVKHFGQDYLGTERKLIQHLQSLPYVDPVLNQTHFVVMVQGKRGRKTLVTSSPRELQGYQQQHAVKGVNSASRHFPIVCRQSSLPKHGCVPSNVRMIDADEISA